jgi:Rod binding domain-containing protein
MQIGPVSPESTLAPELMSQLRIAGDNPAAQTKAVSQQFEAILLRQFLDKSVGSMMGEGGGNGGDIYGYMLSSVLSQKLAEGGGFGMASVLEHQLSPRGNTAATQQKQTP